MRTAFLLMALLVGAVVGRVSADDSALYWMVDEKNTIEFSYAVVHAVNGSEDTILPPVDGNWRIDGSDGTTMTGLTDLGSRNWSSYAFYIELLQWDDTTSSGKSVGISQTSSYADLVTNHHVGGTGMSIPDFVVFWAPTVVVPEPTSGLLVLLGGALLLLRRRDNAA